MTYEVGLSRSVRAFHIMPGLPGPEGQPAGGDGPAAARHPARERRVGRRHLGDVAVAPPVGLDLAHGRVSLGWILLWVTVILGARELARLLFPRASHSQIALLTGLFSVATAALRAIP